MCHEDQHLLHPGKWSRAQCVLQTDEDDQETYFLGSLRDRMQSCHNIRYDIKSAIFRDKS